MDQLIRDKNKIKEIETGKSPLQKLKMETKKNKLPFYVEELNSAEKEILFVTSSDGIIENWKNFEQLKKWTTNGVYVRIMSPITNENLQAALHLMDFCEIRHVPDEYPRVTIIDQKRLFQFIDNVSEANVQDIFYSNNSQYIKNTIEQLSEVWNNSQRPSAITLDSIINSPKIKSQLLSDEPVPNSLRKIKNVVVTQDVNGKQQLSEKAIIKKIIDAQKKPDKTHKDNLIRQYGNAGQAIVYPPKSLNLPNLLFYMFHNDKHSTHEAQDYLIVCTQQETPNGLNFLPAAFIYDNPDETLFWEKLWSGIKFSQNLQLVDKDKLQIEVHGNTLFAGWTDPIPLVSSS